MNGAFTPLPGTSSKGDVPNNAAVRRVIGVDPGIRDTGFAVLDYSGNRYRLASYGVISTKTGTPQGERLNAIYNRLTDIIAEFQPREAGMETLFFARNVTSAFAVSEARGVVTLCLTRNNLRVREYTPNAIKQAVSGNARADKKLVQEYVKILLGLPEIPKPDHAADAIAVAITYLHTMLLPAAVNVAL
jgi:crossover junction endodeoxyribonuclease RuvC